MNPGPAILQLLETITGVVSVNLSFTLVKLYIFERQKENQSEANGVSGHLPSCLS